MKTKITRFMNNSCQLQFKAITILTFIFMFGINVVKANDLVIKQYAVADVEMLVSDIIAGNADVYELTESGGLYSIISSSGNNIEISKNTFVRSASGLAEKPVISLQTSTTTGVSANIFRVLSPDLTIKFEGIDFNGYNTYSDIQPILIIVEAGATNCNLIIKDCYIHQFKNVTQSNGTIKLIGIGASLDMQGTVIEDCINRIINFATATTADAANYGDLILRNNTFCNIDASNTILIYFLANAKGTNAVIDHCTFYKFVSNYNLIYFRKMYGSISLTNSLFVKINGNFIFNNPAPLIDHSYLAGFASSPSGTNTIEVEPVFTDTVNLDFSIINHQSFICQDNSIAGNTMYYELPNSSPSLMDQTDDISIYLNHDDKIVINRKTWNKKTLRINIYNVSGQLIASQQSLDCLTSISIPHIVGLYIVTVSDGNISVAKKITIQ